MGQYYALCITAELQREAARTEMAIAHETDLINAGEADGQMGLPPRFPEDPRYWASYCDGARQHWIQRLDREHFLPSEF